MNEQLPDQITDDEQTQLFYLLQKCQQAQQRLAMAQEDQMTIRVFDLHRQALWQRYGLGDGDQVLAGGKIARAQVVRAPQLPSPAPAVPDFRGMPEHIPAGSAQGNGQEEHPTWQN